MATAHARVLTLNCRKSTIIEAVPSHRWAARKANLISYLRKLEPEIIGLQEATVVQCTDIMHGLGENWTYAGGVKAGNVPVAWDSLKYDAVDGSLIEMVMPSGLRKRYATFVQLTSRATGETAWFGSAHLAQGGPTEPNAASLRRAQITRIGERIKLLSDNQRVILCGDFNDPTGRTILGDVRHLAADKYGLRCIRSKLTNAVINGESYNSSQHFKTTLREYRWIDDVLT